MYYKLPKININIKQIIKNFFTYDNDIKYDKITNTLDFSQLEDITNNINEKIAHKIDNDGCDFFSFNDMKNIYNINHLICNKEYYEYINFLEIMNHFFRKKKFINCLEISENVFLKKLFDKINDDTNNEHNIINIFEKYDNHNSTITFENFLELVDYHFDFVFIDVNISNEKYHFIELLCIYISILMNVLNHNGDSIIKIPCVNLENVKIYYEIIFLLILIFEEVYICKPKCDSFDSNYFYLICKNKNIIFNKFDLFNITINLFQNAIEKPDNKFVKSFLNIETPLFIQNKIIESFINLYHHKLEVYHQMYNLLLINNNNQFNDKINILKSKQNNKLNYWKAENLYRENFCKICPEENTNETF